MESIEPRRLEYTVPSEQAGRSVGELLRQRFRFSGSLYRSLKWRDGAFTRNGETVRANESAAEGDRLGVLLTERRPPSGKVVPCALALDILFEDEDLLVINKPAGVSMHEKTADQQNPVPTLAGALQGYLGPDRTAHFVSRLDKGTSGVLLAAKSGYLHDRFRRMLHTAALYREYLAVSRGRVSPAEGEITLPLAREENRFDRYRPDPGGRPAQTAYTVLAENGRYSLLRLLPRTGRTHQLRVHMSALGFPLAGDGVYGGGDDSGMSRPALHSCRLRFTHPVTERELEFTAPLPEDMLCLIQREGFSF